MHLAHYTSWKLDEAALPMKCSTHWVESNYWKQRADVKGERLPGTERIDQVERFALKADHDALSLASIAAIAKLIAFCKAECDSVCGEGARGSVAPASAIRGATVTATTADTAARSPWREPAAPIFLRETPG